MSEEQDSSRGTGHRLGYAAVVLAGIASLVAILMTLVSIWLQTKNYRKPLLQRYVIRILIMVPIYAAASWASLVSMKAASWIDPFRDVYEAFTIYTFLQLLINFIGGERALIVLMHGREPVNHLWPLNHCLPRVDISDPHTFLAIKRGILQYTWIKPLLAIATIIMKSTDTYQEGFIGVTSGYFWSGLIYNVSITICLYALALFWVVMSHDLTPFRPMPKFLCIKGIIFASYWQGFFLSILVWLGAIPDSVPGYTPDNLAAAIQDALICFEMPLFAILHWHAFSWHDYADVTISAARLPVKYALRDAFGPRDLIEDTKETLGGKQYEYREFDAHDNVMTHEASSSRYARIRQGMRYERGGKGKYWIPAPGQHDPRTPLLSNSSRARTMSPGARRALDSTDYGAASEENLESYLDDDEEALYAKARALEFGDWNYPVITAHTASREEQLLSSPTLVTASTNRHVLQPTKENKRRRKSQIAEIQSSPDKGRHSHKKRHSRHDNGEGSSSSASKPRRESIVKSLLSRHDSNSSSGSGKSDRSQLVDLVVEDHDAEEIERVRARKEGGAGWNEAEPKHFVRTYPESAQQEEVREGYDPDQVPINMQPPDHNPGAPVGVVGGERVSAEQQQEQQQSAESVHWQRRDYNDGDDEVPQTPVYENPEDRNPWSSPSRP